jgi:uncharacterized protein YjiK
MRTSLLLALALTFAASSAMAQLSIVQQWTVSEFPGGIAYAPDDDTIWIVDDSGNTFREYTRTGTFLSSFPGTQVGTSLPVGLEYEEGSGHLWCADETTAEQVVECTKDGVFVSSFSVDADMQDAVAIAYANSTGLLYVGDDNASEVVSWTTGGTLMGRWTTTPYVTDTDAICYLDASNTLLVGDDNGAVIHEFTLDGTQLTSYDMSAQLGITGVEGLSYDPATGNVFLGDSSSPRVLYEISGFVQATPVEPATWGSIKSQFR